MTISSCPGLTGFSHGVNEGRFGILIGILLVFRPFLGIICSDPRRDRRENSISGERESLENERFSLPLTGKLKNIDYGYF